MNPRRDTLKFEFDRNYAKPRSVEFEDWIDLTLKIPLADVIGIYYSIIKHEVYLKVSSPEVGERIIAETNGTAKFRYSDGHIGEVVITQEGLGIRTIRIFELPFEVTADSINAVLQPYGRVLNNFAERFSQGHKYPVLNGIRQVRIDLKSHVPSYITVAGYRAIVIYDGQPRTCAACNKPGHVRAECMQRRIAQLPREEPRSSTDMVTLPVTYASTARKALCPETDMQIAELEVSLPLVEIDSSTQVNQEVEPVVATTPKPEEKNTDLPLEKLIIGESTVKVVEQKDAASMEAATSVMEVVDTESPSTQEGDKKKRRLKHRRAEDTEPQQRQRARLMTEDEQNRQSVDSKASAGLIVGQKTSDTSVETTERPTPQKTPLRPEETSGTLEPTAAENASMHWADDVENVDDVDMVPLSQRLMDEPTELMETSNDDTLRQLRKSERKSGGKQGGFPPDESQ